jgi:hypothetical protein
MPLEETEVQQLTQGGETFLHAHPRHIMDADDVFNQEAARPILYVNINYTVKPNDEIIVVDTSGGNVTVTLIRNTTNKEYCVVKASAANTLTVVPTAPDTFLGTASVTVTAKLAVVRCKRDAVASTWFLI